MELVGAQQPYVSYLAPVEEAVLLGEEVAASDKVLGSRDHQLTISRGKNRIKI